MRICFVGPISPPVSGPGVKNKIMVDWLETNGNLTIKKFNTYDFRHLKFKAIFSGFKNFLFTRIIFLSVSENGRFLFIPICYFFRKKIILFPAGGSFDLEISNLKKWKRKLFLRTANSVKITYTQTIDLKKGLEVLGFKNVTYFPNPRMNRGCITNNIFSSKNVKIIFLSKIREGKGPLLLIEAVEKVRKKLPGVNIQLNFFGIVDDTFKDVFSEALKKNENNKYQGVANPEDVQKVISEHHIFVLPTFFREGIPGAVVEAMFTGIPIIVSNFTAADALIDHYINGIIIPQNNEESLVLAIEELIRNNEMRRVFSDKILIKSKKFDIDIIMKSILTDLEKIK